MRKPNMSEKERRQKFAQAMLRLLLKRYGYAV